MEPDDFDSTFPPVARNRDRGEDGLLESQRKYFQILSQVGKKETACAAVGIPVRQISRWLREDPAFLRAHEGFFGASREATKARFAELQERLPDLAMELMEASKVVTVKHNCTSCGMENVVSIDTTNDTVRARMWADLMKATGHLVDTKRIEGEVTHVTLTAGQRIAFEKLKRGLPISVQQRKDLEQMGLLEDLKMYDGSTLIDADSADTIEGEVL